MARYECFIIIIIIIIIIITWCSAQFNYFIETAHYYAYVNVIPNTHTHTHLHTHTRTPQGQAGHAGKEVPAHA